MTTSTYQKIRKQLSFTILPGLLWRHVSVDALALGASVGAVRYFPLMGILLAAPVLACVYFRAFGLMHEAVHGIASQNPKINLWVGRIAGWLCFLPFEAWREIHLQHHYWSGNLEQDPSMKLVERIKHGRGGNLKLLNAAWRSGIPLMAFGQHLVFWIKSAQISDSTAQRRRFLIGLLGWGIALVGVGFLHALPMFLLSLVLYLMLVETVNFPHHLDLPQMEGQGRLKVWDQHLVSRTCLYQPQVARWALLNFNYHVEHHLFPTLPFHQLPQAHGLVQSCLGEEMNLSQGHNWIVEHRRMKLEHVFVGPELKIKSDAPNETAARVTA